MNTIIVAALALVSFSAAYKDPHYWDNRSVIVHFFEWKFDDIANECENFLQYHGVGGVQVSPVNENLIIEDRPWYERYQPMSYSIISRSGDEAAFLDMATRCNAVGIRIYVDVVFNHMTGSYSGLTGTGGSTGDSDSKDYPGVPYSGSDFHNSCSITDYTDAENVRNCELSGLKDLDQSNSYVREKVVAFLNKLISLGAAGFRVDAAKHMWPADLEAIYSQVNDLNIDFGFPSGSRPYIYQEVIDLGGEGVSKTEYTDFGAVTEFVFGATLGTVFRGNENMQLSYLSNWGPSWGLIAKDEDALVFIENHDNQRGHGAGGDQILTYKDAKQYKMAIAFMLAHTYGTPRILSSYYFEDTNAGPPADAYGNIISPEIEAGACKNGWVCEHRWRQIYQMIEFRNAVSGTDINDWWTDDNQQIAFGRGNKGFIAFTNSGDLKQTLQTGLPAGVYCDIISGGLENGACTGKSVTVNNDSTAYFEILKTEDDGVVAVHVNARLS